MNFYLIQPLLLICFSFKETKKGGGVVVGQKQKVRKLITRKVFTDRFGEENTQLARVR